MGGSLESFAVDAMTAIVGHDDINDFLINRLVNQARNRPHPWTTLNGYISWTGLTDRSYDSRLLRAAPYPQVDALGTRRPPIADVTALFAARPGGQRVCAKSTCLFPAFAQYLTDGFIRTRVSNDPPFGDGVEDRRRSTSNHEIDQSPLYGRNAAQTDVLRAKSSVAGQRGRLKSQMISGGEFPPFLFDANGKPFAEFCDAAGRPILDLPLGLHVDAGAAHLVRRRRRPCQREPAGGDDEHPVPARA